MEGNKKILHFYGFWINNYENNNSQFEILIKKILATKYYIQLKNSEINCIKKLKRLMIKY